MWKKLLRTTLIAALVLSSCTDNDVYKGPKEDEKEFNNFPFSTVQKDVNLNVNYVNGTVQSNVYLKYMMKCLLLKANTVLTSSVRM